jgi:hypothetical protein
MAHARHKVIVGLFVIVSDVSISTFTAARSCSDRLVTSKKNVVIGIPGMYAM